ncbi:hypothetical protein C8J57DRAFT_1704772 [Mycena rebaudengoi]|nr:hypothetical protein C8J57DRAFT_1704772 [Mycena rebaudengoi]
MSSLKLAMDRTMPLGYSQLHAAFRRGRLKGVLATPRHGLNAIFGSPSLHSPVVSQPQLDILTQAPREVTRSTQASGITLQSQSILEISQSQPEILPQAHLEVTRSIQESEIVLQSQSVLDTPPHPPSHCQYSQSSLVSPLPEQVYPNGPQSIPYALRDNIRLTCLCTRQALQEPSRPTTYRPHVPDEHFNVRLPVQYMRDEVALWKQSTPLLLVFDPQAETLLPFWGLILMSFTVYAAHAISRDVHLHRQLEVDRQVQRNARAQAREENETQQFHAFRPTSANLLPPRHVFDGPPVQREFLLPRTVALVEATQPPTAPPSPIEGVHLETNPVGGNVVQEKTEPVPAAEQIAQESASQHDSAMPRVEAQDDNEEAQQIHTFHSASTNVAPPRRVKVSDGIPSPREFLLPRAAPLEPLILPSVGPILRVQGPPVPITEDAPKAIYVQTGLQEKAEPNAGPMPSTCIKQGGSSKTCAPAPSVTTTPLGNTPIATQGAIHVKGVGLVVQSTPLALVPQEPATHLAHTPQDQSEVLVSEEEAVTTDEGELMEDTSFLFGMEPRSQPSSPECSSDSDSSPDSDHPPRSTSRRPMYRRSIAYFPSYRPEQRRALSPILETLSSTTTTAPSSPLAGGSRVEFPTSLDAAIETMMRSNLGGGHEVVKKEVDGQIGEKEAVETVERSISPASEVPQTPPRRQKSVHFPISSLFSPPRITNSPPRLIPCYETEGRVAVPKDVARRAQDEFKSFSAGLHTKFVDLGWSGINDLDFQARAPLPKRKEKRKGGPRNPVKKPATQRRANRGGKGERVMIAELAEDLTAATGSGLI